MNTQNLKKAFGSFALVALLSSPIFAEDSANSTVSAASAPAAPAASATLSKSNTLLPAPDRSTPAGSTISGNLDVSHAVSTIEGLDTSNREKLLGEITARVGATDQQVNDLKSKTTDIKPEIRDSINSAWNEYQKAKTRLDQSIQTARSTEGVAWERYRSGLAADYAFYASAVAGVEVSLPN